jgi:hypothetical protein
MRAIDRIKSVLRPPTINVTEESGAEWQNVPKLGLGNLQKNS